MKTHEIPVAQILVDQGRQRREISEEGLESLANSIIHDGLINPISVRPLHHSSHEYQLIAGERRLRAYLLKGIDLIRCTVWEDANEIDSHRIELAENVHRENLTWQEECLAVYDYHLFQSELVTDWTPDKCAAELSYKTRMVYRFLQVGERLKDKDEKIWAASSFSAARGLLEREATRGIEDELAVATHTLLKVQSPEKDTAKVKLEKDLLLQEDWGIIPKDAPIVDLAVPEGIRDPRLDIIEYDALKWLNSYDEMPFNVIHCDFPYGIGLQSSDQASSESRGAYDDTPDTYFDLCEAFFTNTEYLCATYAHVVFWFSFTMRVAKTKVPDRERLFTDSEGVFDNYAYLRSRFSESDFKVWPRPLVWVKSDKSGIIPDPTRGPRRIYETAIFASTGDRKIIKPTVDAVSYPTPGKAADHLSEKPEEVLATWLSMLVDEGTRFLDPTCGGGTSIAVAERLGAKHVTGLELDSEYADRARKRLIRTRLSIATGKGMSDA